MGGKYERTEISVAKPCYFFGTFNPVHWGHLVMAEAALEQSGCDEVVFVPAHVPPHRENDEDLAPFAHRLEMLRLACEDNPKFNVSDIESKREGPSYTVDTLRILVPDLEKAAESVSVIIGTDALRQLPTWKEPLVLIEKVRFMLAPREGVPIFDMVYMEEVYVPVQKVALAMPQIGVSSTLIRQRHRDGKSLRYLTPQPVIEYMDANKLY
jgi:nicotinate-nucleotide adenylyltransferase